MEQIFIFFLFFFSFLIFFILIYIYNLITNTNYNLILKFAKTHVTNTKYKLTLHYIHSQFDLMKIYRSVSSFSIASNLKTFSRSLKLTRSLALYFLTDLK